MKHRKRRLAVGALIVSMGASATASANDPKYVSDLKIQAPKELIKDAVLDHVKDVAKEQAVELLNATAMTFLNAFAGGFFSGIGSLLNVGGGGGVSDLVPAILADIKTLANQAGQRFDALDEAINNQTIDTVVQDLNDGIDLLNQYQATPLLDGKYERRGTLEQALTKLASATNLIEAFTQQDTTEASISLWQLHMIAFGLYVTATNEYQLIAELGAETQGESVDKGTWLVAQNKVSGFAAGFQAKVDAAVKAALSAKVQKLFDFYSGQGAADPSTANKRGVAAGLNRVGKLVDSWFTFTPGQNKCWDSANDTAWESELQNPAAWNSDCNSCGTNRPSSACGNTAGAPWWYYNVHAPNAKCLEKTNSDDELEWKACNRFMILADSATTYHGDFDHRFQTFSDGLVIPDEHYRRVYAAYLFQVYGPIKPFLDGIWTTMGNPGSRPPNGLDADLDVQIDVSLATAVDPAAVLQAFAGKMNFEMMPGNSTAMAMASMFTTN